MEVAKRLEFDPTETLTSGLQDPAQQRFHTANMAALQELQQTVQDLSVAAKQKQSQIMALARQTAEQGIGDNDLKRLQRQFDSNKATFVNIDQKQRFMKGLWDLELDIDHLTAVKDDQELRLEKGAEALRTIKAQNEQARQKLSSTCGSISQMYSFVEQATEATAAQLESTKLALQQHAAKQPAVAEALLEPGPGQIEAQQLVEAETAQARKLERSITAAETLLLELESKAAGDRQSLAALRAEVEHLEVLAANRTKAADADKHIKESTAWCEQLLALMCHMSGLSVKGVNDYSISLGIDVCVPTTRQEHSSRPVREISHVMTLWFQGGSGLMSSSLGSLDLVKFKLAPACVDISDLVVNNEGSDEGLARMVREVRGRLLSYWRRQVLVEAAAEAFPPSSSSRGPPHIRATLDNQAEVEVLVPLSWPSETTDTLRVVELSAPELSTDAAAQLMQQVNNDAQLLAHCDVLTLLHHVSAAVEAHLVDAPASLSVRTGP